MRIVHVVVSGLWKQQGPDIEIFDSYSRMKDYLEDKVIEYKGSFPHFYYQRFINTDGGYE